MKVKATALGALSYRCGNNNEYLHKHAAIEILNRIVEGSKKQLGNTSVTDSPLV